MCLMKKFMKSFALLAVAALGLSACNDDKLVPDNGNADGKFVTVHFGAEAAIEGATKATLTPDDGETAFQAAWENEDKIAVKYTYVDGDISKTVPGTWDASASKFSAEIQDLTEGEGVLEMKYQASYPYSETGYVDFGSARTQTGNVYNSVYDLMVAEPVTVTAKPGLDESGNAIVFPMQRQTAIAYFHFTSDNTEAITKATLRVEGEGAAIAAETVLLEPTGMDYETGLSEIVLTTTGQTADDFTFWFNVLPTTYTKMTLIVETATKTFTISNTKGGSYAAGKLYKVKKNGIAWTDKAVTPSVSVVNVDNVNVVKAMGNGSYGDYKDKVQTITVDGLEYSMTNICANSKNGQNGYLMAAKQFIQMKKSTSYILNTKSGVTNIKAWVLPATTSAISVYQGSTSDNISTLITTPTKTTQTVNLISNTGSNVDRELDVYEYTITDGFFKLAPSAAALWLYKLEVTYSNSGSSDPAPDTYTVSCETVTGGTLSATPSEASAGTEVTITATPDKGYEFNNDWIVTNAETSETITVTGGKFTMPAANVNVTASFKQLSYAITANPAENGTYTVKVGEEEVTSAVYGAKVLLEATPAEGYICDGWTVVDAESNSVYVSNNSFTMPASAVTISTTFSVKPEDITYDHAGTAEDPYSVADVLKYISTLGTETSTEDVYVKGVITSIDEVSTKFGNATYKIKDEGVDNEVKVFRGLYLDGAKFTSADQIGVGDEVIVVGKVLDYSGTPEVNAGNKIVSIIKAPYLKATASKETGIAAAGETVTITVDTNVDSWTATSDNADFVVETPSGNTVDVVVSENTDATERTATITVTAGTLSETITLTQKGAGSTITYESYSTGFESTEGFTAGTNYQSTVTVGAEGKQWKIFYGTPSTSSKITGSQSLAMRLYTSNNYGYAEMQFDVPGATKVSFKAKAATSKSAVIKLTIKESTDGGTTWTTVNNWSARSLNNTADDYSFTVSGNPEKYRIRFEIDSSSTKPKSQNAQLTIDDVTISVD